MAISITHPFVSAIADGGDATLVRPSNWNAGHTVTGASANPHGAADHSDRTRRLWLGANVWMQGTGAGTLALRGTAANWYDKTPGWSFDGASWEAVVTTAHMPADWDGGAVTPKLFWCPTTAPATQNAYWQLLGAAIAAGEQIDQSGTEFNILTAIDAGAVAEQLIISTLSTIAPTDPYLRLSVSRRADNALDTYDGVDCWFFGLLLEYTADM